MEEPVIRSTVAPEAPASTAIERIIEWLDTDASGHYHYTAALRLFDEAETALLERLGLIKVFGRLPRVHVSVDYQRTLWFRDRVKVRVTVEEVGRSSIRYRFSIVSGGETCATATVVAVLLSANDGTPQPWSGEHRRLLMTAGPVDVAAD